MTGLAIIIVTIVLVQNLSFRSPRTSASIPPQEKPSLPLPSAPSIAVLPFANLSEDPNLAYFSEGLTDNLVTRVSRLPGVFVSARNPTLLYKGKVVSVQQMGRELGVRTILQGSVLKTDSQVRINTQLADTSDGTSLWAQSFDRSLKDALAAQDDIVREIVTTLGLLFKLNTMNHWRLVLQDAQTENVEAFDDLPLVRIVSGGLRKRTTRKPGRCIKKPWRGTLNGQRPMPQ